MCVPTSTKKEANGVQGLAEKLAGRRRAHPGPPGWTSRRPSDQRGYNLIFGWKYDQFVSQLCNKVDFRQAASDTSALMVQETNRRCPCRCGGQIEGRVCCETHSCSSKSHRKKRAAICEAAVEFLRLELGKKQAATSPALQWRCWLLGKSMKACKCHHSCGGCSH